jgi:T-complex protein 1 subunit eta
MQNIGVDVNTGGVVDTYNAFVWEPSLVKINALQSATEAACLILSVDETVGAYSCCSCYWLVRGGT